jgi:hypothetical protein
MKSVGTVHSLDRVNRRVDLEGLGQRRCARISNRVVAQAECAFSGSGIVILCKLKVQQCQWNRRY